MRIDSWLVGATLGLLLLSLIFKPMGTFAICSAIIAAGAFIGLEIRYKK